VKFWLTLLAQAFNFFVLLFILYKVLYKPVRNTMRTREAQIKQRYDEAEGKIEAAETARAEAEAKQHEIDAQRTALLDEAKTEAAARRDVLIADARREADEQIARAREAIGREWRQAAEHLSALLGNTVTTICTTVLETSGESLTDRAVAEVIERIGSLEGADLDEAQRAVERGQVRLFAAVEVTEEIPGRVRDALGVKLGHAGVSLPVERDDSLVAGVELAIGTLRIRSHWRERLDEALAAARSGLLDAVPHSASEQEHMA